jgi:hypothetical protein
MIYCSLIDDYVDQNSKCVRCEHYLFMTDSCGRRELDDDLFDDDEPM